MVTAHKRGWQIVFIDDSWVYADTLTTITQDRPCFKCSELPTPEGYDSCLGFIENCSSACCGHGVSDPILMVAN